METKKRLVQSVETLDQRVGLDCGSTRGLHAHRANQFIEFKLDGVTITVLGIFESEIP